MKIKKPSYVVELFLDAGRLPQATQDVEIDETSEADIWSSTAISGDTSTTGDSATGLLSGGAKGTGGSSATSHVDRNSRAPVYPYSHGHAEGIATLNDSVGEFELGVTWSSYAGVATSDVFAGYGASWDTMHPDLADSVVLTSGNITALAAQVLEDDRAGFYEHVLLTLTITLQVNGVDTALTVTLDNQDSIDFGHQTPGPVVLTTTSVSVVEGDLIRFRQEFHEDHFGLRYLKFNTTLGYNFGGQKGVVISTGRFT